MGSVKKWVNAGGLMDPAGSMERVKTTPYIGGTFGKEYNKKLNDPITLHNMMDPGGGLREDTTHVKGSANPLGPPQPATPFDPKAPGSIFNMQQSHGPYTPPPPAGSYTNGLGGMGTAGGQQPDWNAIIANALRAPGVPNNRNGMPMQQAGQMPTQQTTQPLPINQRAWS